MQIASYSRAEKKRLSFVLSFSQLEIAIYRMYVRHGKSHGKSRITRVDSAMQMEYKETDV